ncbi:hypothetical protein PENSUB_3701 [Penicillium subrubescens]|uniref:Uncharacterized protein n=1 Tax=Penicillium subrubescens TaxID=1316194 RepID=A0A1Q5UEI0_9EURO|nr:hypothetical protein PENSUB_3701 [Penicillium subrubescens]
MHILVDCRSVALSTRGRPSKLMYSRHQQQSQYPSSATVIICQGWHNHLQSILVKAGDSSHDRASEMNFLDPQYLKPSTAKRSAPSDRPERRQQPSGAWMTAGRMGYIRDWRGVARAVMSQ